MALPALSTAAKGWLIILFSGSTWGITFSLAKIATDLGAHPLGLTLWQGVLGGAAVFIFNLARRVSIPLGRSYLFFYLVCGLLGTAVPSTLFFYAADNLPAGVLSIVVALVPIMSFAVAVPLGLDRPTVLRLVGVALGFVAIAMMIGPETSLPAPGLAPWLLFGVAASACYAIENNYIALRKPADTDSFTILCGMFVVSAIVMAPVVAATGTFVPLTSPLGTVELCVIAMALINVFSYGLFVYLVTATGPVFASQMSYVVTTSGVFWGIVIFGEQHSPWIWGALAVMLAGLALVKPVTDAVVESTG